MHKVLWLQAILSAIVATAPIAYTCMCQGKKGAEVEVAKQQMAAGYAVRRALIIGIQDYPNVRGADKLSWATNDARGFATVLKASYGFKEQNIEVLLNKQASKANIERAMADLANTETVGPNDQIVIFFSGHGTTLKQEKDNLMGALVPADAKLDLRENNPGAKLRECITMEWVRGTVKATPAKHVLLVADCCFGGDFATAKGGHSEEAIESMLLTPAKEFMSAGKKDERAWEIESLQHGAFTYQLLNVLAERAKPKEAFTAEELFTEVKRRVMSMSGVRQTPQRGSFETDGSFLWLPEGAVLTAPAESRTTNKPSNSPATPGNLGIGSTMRTKVGDIELVYVPAGEFTMGNDKPDEHFEDEKPVRKVYLDAYWIGVTEVTVKQFRAFCEDTGYTFGWKYWETQMGKPFVDELPMTWVSWDEARAFCEWAGGDLPSEAQWEKAARGPKGLPFPWGQYFNRSWLGVHDRIPFEENLARALLPFQPKTFPKDLSAYGCYDMAGNATEWCRDWYGPYDPLDLRNPKGPTAGTDRVQRPRSMGLDTPQGHANSARSHKSPFGANNLEGFRVVMEVRPPGVVHFVQ